MQAALAVTFFLIVVHAHSKCRLCLRLRSLLLPISMVRTLRKPSLRVRLQLVLQELARIQRTSVGSDVVHNFCNGAMTDV